MGLENEPKFENAPGSTRDELGQLVAQLDVEAIKKKVEARQKRRSSGHAPRKAMTKVELPPEKRSIDISPANKKKVIAKLKKIKAAKYDTPLTSLLAGNHDAIDMKKIGMLQHYLDTEAFYYTAVLSNWSQPTLEDEYEKLAVSIRDQVAGGSPAGEIIRGIKRISWSVTAIEALSIKDEKTGEIKPHPELQKRKFKRGGVGPEITRTIMPDDVPNIIKDYYLPLVKTMFDDWLKQYKKANKAAKKTKNKPPYIIHDGILSGPGMVGSLVDFYKDNVLKPEAFAIVAEAVVEGERLPFVIKKIQDAIRAARSKCVENNP
jgi:hypothetical protein